MRIRQMKLSDLQQVVEIERESFSLPWSEKVYRETLENEGALYLVAELERSELQNQNNQVKREIIGICGLMNIVGEGDISNVAVKKDERGKGIAYKMVQELLHLGKEQKIEMFILEVRENNCAAIRLYQKCGFEEVGRRKAFYEKPVEDAVIMSKKVKIKNRT